MPTLAETEGPFEHQCSVGDKDNYRNTEIHNHKHRDTKVGSELPDWSNQSVSNFFVHCMLKDILGLYKEGYCGKIEF